MDLLITNIKGLVRTGENLPPKFSGKEMSDIGLIDDAFVAVKDGLISDYGTMNGLPESYFSTPQKIDASGKYVFPSFCDSHTHLVYAGSRETEFTDKIRGLSYEEIARRGGGILNSAARLHETTEDELYEQALRRINEISGFGTGAVEIKSGYGLATEDELKMLRVIRRLRKESLLEIRSTFLGAHAIPAKYKHDRDGYIDLVINEMIPKVAAEGLADYIDVFCDEGFFSVSETERILKAGMKYSLIPKIHANELGFSGGVQAGVKFNALSVDHLERSGVDEIKSLDGTRTMPTLLPGSAFFLGLPDPPARMMIDSGLPVAVSSDYNPGSAPSGNMKLIISLACIRLKMLPEEAINAATINSAYAMGISDTYGSITRGKVASMFITSEMPSIDYFPYAFGSNLVETIILKGKIIPPQPS